jgi:integrase
MHKVLDVGGLSVIVRRVGGSSVIGPGVASRPTCRTPQCHTDTRRSRTAPTVRQDLSSAPPMRTSCRSSIVAQIVKRVTTDGEARYDVRVRIGGRVATKTFRRRRDADAFAATIESDRLRGTLPDPRMGRQSVSAVATSWIESNPDKRPTTWAADEHALRHYILPVLGHREVGSVAPTEIQDLVNRWCSVIAPRTVRRHYGVLRAVFSYAVATDTIARSPCRGIKLPPIAPARSRLLSPADVAAIAAAMETEDRPVVWLAALLGLRWSEVAGLRVGRVDFENYAVSVVETVTRGRHGELVSGPPKSRAGRRRLPMPEGLSEMLLAHLRARGLTETHSEAFVFGDGKGGPLHYSNWRTRVWLPACAKAGVEGAGFHDLRRANATVMIAEGIDVKTAQQRLGHSDVRMTLGLYAKVIESADRSASDVLASRFLGNGAPTTGNARDGRAMAARKGVTRDGPQRWRKRH